MNLRPLIRNAAAAAGVAALLLGPVATVSAKPNLADGKMSDCSMWGGKEGHGTLANDGHAWLVCYDGEWMWVDSTPVEPIEVDPPTDEQPEPDPEPEGGEESTGLRR